MFGSLGVYVWGSGRFGQLGFEDVADKRTPTLQTILESLMYNHLDPSLCPLPTSIHLHLIVDTLFSQKQNEKIQDSNKKQSHSKPSRSCLVQLAAGGNCTAVIHGTFHYSLMSLPLPIHYALKYTHKHKPTNKTRRILTFCWHKFFLELNGVSHIYMFGRNDMGQLGLVKEPNSILFYIGFCFFSLDH